MSDREVKAVGAYPSRDVEIGRWLWALQDGRQLMLEELDRVTPAMVDWQPADGESSIGSVLYHIAAIEVDWLYVEILEQDIPAKAEALVPYDTRDGQGLLTQVAGQSLEAHLGRLETARGWLLDAFRRMDLAEFRRIRSFPEYDVTPEWVLYHLMQHEAEHRSQVGALRNAARHSLST